MSAPHALDQLAISSTGFVFDQRTGGTFTVNPTGRLLLEALRDSRSIRQASARLAEAFDTDAADLDRDVRDFVRALQREGLLPASFELEA